MTSSIGSAPRVALIGYGAIGRTLSDLLHDRLGLDVAVVVRPGSAGVDARGPVLTGAAELEEFAPGIVVECAGHAALQEYGPGVLSGGARLIVASSGALADPALETALRGAAREGGGRIEIVAGALAGLDALASIPPERLGTVTYRGIKAPSAWRGSPAETMLDLDAITGEAIFFRGTAREAAWDFPKNANVVAAVALAGAGFDATRATLVADANATGNTHRIEAEGPFGHLAVEISAAPLAANPRTSSMTPESLFRAVRNQAASFVV